MFNLAEYHEEFLNSLPIASFRRVSLKIVILFSVGFLLSVLSSVVVLIFLKLEGVPASDKFVFAITKFFQDLPLVIITLFLFYKGATKTLLANLFPTKAAKGFILIAATLIFYLVLGVLISLILFTFFYPLEVWDWLESYVQSSPSAFTLPYLLEIAISFILFFVMAFSEEFIFRFTIFRFLRRRSFLLSLLASSLIFTLLHGSQGFVGVFVFSSVVTVYYEYTNFFLGAVVLHSLYNLFIPYYINYLTYLVLR